MGVLDKLAYWQSRAFFVLTNEHGKVVEREAGTSRPKDVEFVKGGRRAALAAAGERWPGAVVEAAAKSRVRSMRQRLAAESGEVEEEPEPRGEKPTVGEPIEPVEDVKLSPKRERVSPARAPITRQRFTPITQTLKGRGLEDI